MRVSRTILSFVLVSAFVVAGAGCGDSTPTPVSSASETSAFAPVSAAELAQATVASDCNLDQVNGQTANDAPLDHYGTGEFFGWVADRATGKVPPQVGLILVGKRDYAVQATTGAARPDVAAATGIPAFATSGYSIVAGLSAVPVGEYSVALMYRLYGKNMLCHTQVKLSVQ